MQQPIVDLVEQIPAHLRTNPETDVGDLEAQVDAAVAELYGVAPVGGELSRSQE